VSGGAVQLTATLLAGPTTVTDNQFPSGTTNLPFGLNPPQKAYNVDTGVMVANVISPVAFVALGGVGPGGSVTQAQTLYVRTLTPVQVRLTYLGDVTPKIRYLGGATLEEADPAHPITLVEVMGSATVEYYAAGLQ
jgi:hypothetical protein